MLCGILSISKQLYQQDVVVTHIEDCSKLWVQHCSDGPNLISLMNQMRADLISNPPLAGSFTPRAGLLCAAIFSEDNNWSVSN